MNLSPLRGAGYLLQGLKLLGVPGLRRFVVIPLLLNIVLFSIGIWYGLGWSSQLTGWIGDWLPGWLAWLQWLLLPLFALAVLVALYFSFTTLVNILGAPFNAVLAARVEHHLTGRTDGTEKGWAEIFANLVPDLLNELAKLLHALLWAIPFLLLFLIPGIQLIAPFTWLLFAAWILALEYADYPMSNHGLRGREVRRRLRERRLLSLGFGGAVLVMTMIPLVNFLAMPAAVAGATALWTREFAPDQDQPAA